MEKWIKNNFEENIKVWYERVRLGKEDTLYIDLSEHGDFFPLQNFFLICQQGLEGKLSLQIKTATDADVFRIRHYLYACRSLADRITINGFPYKDMKEVTFFRILPLITIDKGNFMFLSARISDIEQRLQKRIGREMLEDLCKRAESEEEETKKMVTVEQKFLLRLCLTCLYGNIPGFKSFSTYRADYFEREEFRIKVENMPFLAFLIFAVYDRVNHEEVAKEYKVEKGKRENLKKVYMKPEEMPDALPLDDEILADIFNSWDLSDGILQLLENVVEHAGMDNESKTGKGVLSIRIHTNSDENVYLIKEFDQYFKGYENSKKEEYEKKKEGRTIERTEKQYFRDCHEILQNQINSGRFVEETVLRDYEIIRNKIDKRRRSRMGTKHFLDIQIADISGKNLCDVFRENLKVQQYSNREDFENISVRSFFDPDCSEREKFQRYYQDKNIIHHYGLQIFASVVMNNDGFFRVRSHSADNYYHAIYNTSEVEASDLKDCMEGTRYRILLPFHRQLIQESNSMVNTDIMYHTKLWEKKRIVDETKEEIQNFYNMLEECRDTMLSKEEKVYKLQNCLNDHEQDILVFDMDHICTQDIEVFCKTIILYIATGAKSNRQNNIAVINCSTQDFVSIVRIFAVCYDKNGMSDWMRWTQIYLCGKDTREEFLLSGNNVHTLLTRVEKLAFSRKIHPMCIQILRNILERKRSKDGRIYSLTGEENEEFNYTPFDLVLKKEEKTIFENNVKTVLENDIQGLESGCKISPTHMRLGSKIHINMFYEAELLFYNSYYTSRFASLLFENLQKSLSEQGQSLNNKSICLIGYETYSEMLLCELKNIITKIYKIPCEYIVYEIKLDGSINLRYKECVRADMLGVLVVPINSTLTTFNKVGAEVKKRLKSLPILAYLGVIQVMDSSEIKTKDGRTELEKIYWDRKDIEKRRIYSKKLLGENRYASYLVEVKCLWEDPLECKQCFPKDCLFEEALIETNKTSVVPTQLIGLKEETSNSKDITVKRLPSEGAVETLKDYFYQGHIIRDDNHFCYYIRTAAYYQAYKNEISEWLGRVREAIRAREAKDKVIFNIIVNPMHFSNTGFVEAVNEVVFGGASYVLRIESEKEFRDNIQTKYSDLTVLYRNFVKTGKRAEINFYFVDDNIITGKVFYRVRHLIRSLFPEKNNDIVRVNIFSAVIVLLNRLSDFSISNYVNEKQDYYAYLKLNISNLRSYGDACFLCKKEMDIRKLADYSSTNAVNYYWENKKERYKLKTLPEIKKQTQEMKGNVKLERLYRRMIATHYMNERMSELGVEKNNPYAIYKIIVEQIKKSKAKDQSEMMTAYIYSAAYPFIVYRKSCREAVFHMIIILFELFVFETTLEELKARVENNKKTDHVSEEEADVILSMLEESKGIEKIIRKIKNKKEFLKFLIKVSAELKCNYIIRPDRMEMILKRYYDLLEGKDKEKQAEQFKRYYVSMVKKMLSLSSDGSKSMHFERTLISILKTTDSRSKDENISTDFKKYYMQVCKALYLENTGTIFDAAKDLQKNGIQLKEYYLENYVGILKANGIKKAEEQEKVSQAFIDVYDYLISASTGNNKDSSEAYNDYMAKDFQRSIKYYNHLAEKIKILTGAMKVQFLLDKIEWVLKVDEQNNVVFDKTVRRYEVFAQDERGGKVLPVLEDNDLDRMLKNTVMDTVACEGRYAVVVYKKADNRAEKKEDFYFKPIYLVLEYDTEIAWRQLEQSRRILAFRDMMIRRFGNDFGNNVMQNWIEQSRVIKQLGKARAFIHANDSDYDDMTNIWNICKGFFWGRQSDIEKHKDKYGDIQEGCILELMTDIRIGRINLLLLSNSEFREDENPGEHKFRIAEEQIEILKKAYYWKGVCMCDKNGIPLKDRVIEDAIYDSVLEKNISGKYNCVNEYLSYLISETIRSAAIYGKREDGKVKIRIYKEGKYLFICNQLSDGQQREYVLDGLARKGNGISLAVVCEYFIKQYKDRYVKLDMSHHNFGIGLPIFSE